MKFMLDLRRYHFLSTSAQGDRKTKSYPGASMGLAAKIIDHRPWLEVGVE